MSELVDVYLAGLASLAGRSKSIEIIYSSTAVLVGIREYEDALVWGAGCHVTYFLELLGHLVAVAVECEEAALKECVLPFSLARYAYAAFL